VVYAEEGAIVEAGVGDLENPATGKKFEACTKARTATAFGRMGAFLMGAFFSATVGFIA